MHNVPRLKINEAENCFTTAIIGPTMYCRVTKLVALRRTYLRSGFEAEVGRVWNSKRPRLGSHGLPFEGNSVLNARSKPRANQRLGSSASSRRFWHARLIL